MARVNRRTGLGLGRVGGAGIGGERVVRARVLRVFKGEPPAFVVRAPGESRSINEEYVCVCVCVCVRKGGMRETGS